ncbi:unannotated protein [freshwater metagenome]|uniref:Unannotated protein n=1 Tax=freshwater metagenome TaxID=449393 RepID=A0A6J7AHL5_9ZZZZ
MIDPLAPVDCFAFQILPILIPEGSTVLHVFARLDVVEIATSAQYPELQSVVIVVVALTPSVTKVLDPLGVSAAADTAGIASNAVNPDARTTKTTGFEARLFFGDIETSLSWVNP